MVPITLDPAQVTLAIAGNGALALRRLRGLQRAGAANVLVYAAAPDPALQQAAADGWRAGLPDAAALADLHVLWVVGLDHATAAALAAAARAVRVLVNVEDDRAHCDFHSVAEIRRGDLLLTVSTGGAAPGLAGSIRRRMETCFGQEWGKRVAEVAALRTGFRAEGLPMAAAAARIDALVEERCWLTCPQY